MISVAIPAYNEEKNLRDAVLVVNKLSEDSGYPVDIIIVNDGSRDKTGERADQLKKEFPWIQVVHHERNKGMGASFKSALAIAKYPYIIVWPGDNESNPYILRNVVKHCGKAELVLGYVVNTEVRVRGRRILSWLYNFAYRNIFGLEIRYFGSMTLFPVKLVREIDIESSSYGFIPEALTKLLRTGLSFVEVEGYLNPAMQKSSAIRLKVLISETKNLFSLIYSIHFKERARYSFPPKRVIPPVEFTKVISHEEKPALASGIGR